MCRPAKIVPKQPEKEEGAWLYMCVCVYASEWVSASRKWIVRIKRKYLMNIYVTKNSLNNFYQRVARKEYICILSHCSLIIIDALLSQGMLWHTHARTQTFGVSECEKKFLFIYNVRRCRCVWVTFMIFSLHRWEVRMLWLWLIQLPARPPITIRNTIHRTNINRCRFCCVCCCCKI